MAKSANKTAFWFHIYLKDQYNNNNLKLHNTARLKKYLLSVNHKSICPVSPALVFITIWQLSWNIHWSCLVGNLKFLCPQMYFKLLPSIKYVNLSEELLCKRVSQNMQQTLDSREIKWWSGKRNGSHHWNTIYFQKSWSPFYPLHQLVYPSNRQKIYHIHPSWFQRIPVFFIHLNFIWYTEIQLILFPSSSQIQRVFTGHENLFCFINKVINTFAVILH